MIDFSHIAAGGDLTPGDRVMQIIHTCECGAAHLLNVRHYDRVLLKCGRMVWALQPKAYGPLTIFPWPGPPMTSRELAAKEADQRAEGWSAGRWSA